MRFKQPDKQPSDKVLLGARVPIPLYDAFLKTCKADGVTLSEAVRQLIEAHLERRKK